MKLKRDDGRCKQQQTTEQTRNIKQHIPNGNALRLSKASSRAHETRCLLLICLVRPLRARRALSHAIYSEHIIPRINTWACSTVRLSRTHSCDQWTERRDGQPACKQKHTLRGEGSDGTWIAASQSRLVAKSARRTRLQAEECHSTEKIKKKQQHKRWASATVQQKKRRAGRDSCSFHTSQLT
jgi:hypothetical protein